MICLLVYSGLCSDSIRALPTVDNCGSNHQSKRIQYEKFALGSDELQEIEDDVIYGSCYGQACGVLDVGHYFAS